MKYAEFDLNRARGVRITDEIRLYNRILEKSHQLTDEDIEDLKKIGVTKIYGVEMESKDLSFQSALGIVAAKLCGKNTSFVINNDGTARFVAAADGIFECSDDRIAKFNRVAKYFILNTIDVYHKVKAGDVVAELYTNQPVLEQRIIDDIIYALSGNVDMLQVAANQSHKVALLYTHFYNDNAEKKHFTSVVKRLIKEYGDLGLQFINEYNTNHDSESLADTLERVFRDDNDIIFIIPALKNANDGDVVPTALKSLVDDIVSTNIPKVGASDLIIAQKRRQKIISLPYHYDKVSSPLLHRYILQAVTTPKLTTFDFARPQNAYLNIGQALSEEETERLISGNDSELNPDKANVAAVILAAGLSKRAGQNKLLAEVGGEPMFMKAVRAAVKSKASPVFVVTGYQNQEIEEALENVDVNILYNPDYRAGIRTSIRLGLKAVPSFSDGALIIPADMPNLTDTHLNKMIENMKKSKKPQVYMTGYKGQKYNPTLWSKELFASADIVPEDAALRAVLLNVADYTKLIETKDEKQLLDVTFPNDIEELQK